MQRISQTRFFRAVQNKSKESKCLQNYHQHVMVSCTWETGRGGEGWTVGLIPSLGHIGGSIAAASHPVSHLLQEQGFLHYT